jgi:23S rRNA G2445 N2-methylase RlmL
MEAELKRLVRRAAPACVDLKPKRDGDSSLIYPFHPELAWMAVRYLRTPSRALWSLYATTSLRLEPLYEELVELVAADTRGWLADGFGISVYAKDFEEFPAGQLQIQGTVKNAIIEGAARRGMALHLQPERPDLLISVRGSPPVVSVDLAGGSLHQRGWRLDRAEAPLRENVAAQMLMLARWDPRHEALVDPMAGSGTLPIEAALMARGAPLRKHTQPLARRLPALAALAAASAEAPDLFPGTHAPIVAHERSTRELERLRTNATRAGVGQAVTILHGDFRDLAPERLAAALSGDATDILPEAGLVIVNPPYGVRLEADESDDNLDELYARLCDWVLGLGPRWRIAILGLPDRIERVFGREPDLKKPLPNGGLGTYLFVYSQRG